MKLSEEQLGKLPRQVTILHDGHQVTGNYVRHYGQKVQVRGADGAKYTGTEVKVQEKPKFKLGVVQVAVLEYLKLNPRGSFREIAKSCVIPIPRAATVVKSLVIKGYLEKTFKEGRNHYEHKTPATT